MKASALRIVLIVVCSMMLQLLLVRPSDPLSAPSAFEVAGQSSIAARANTACTRRSTIARLRPPHVGEPPDRTATSH